MTVIDIRASIITTEELIHGIDAARSEWKREYQFQYCKNNEERRRVAGALYYCQNKDEIARKGKLYRRKNADIIGSKKAAYRQSHKERKCLYDKCRYLKKREYILSQVKQYRLENPGKVRKCKAEWWSKYRDEINRKRRKPAVIT